MFFIQSNVNWMRDGSFSMAMMGMSGYMIWATIEYVPSPEPSSMMDALATDDGLSRCTQTKW